jgi:hypothetical protein
MDLTDNPNEISVLRQRQHALADAVHQHGIKLELHSLELLNVKKAMELLAASAATGEQLASATQIVQLKLDRLGDDVSTMKNAMVWAVRLVVGAVIMAVIALVLRGAP